ncbi:hypothetical protein PybrP1_005488 [[Pythium] brassicae (nom. inval.)]|nr:hypothetical protein PybrP1_005488 [[Pythium] brassicae (nom. inval.)]
MDQLARLDSPRLWRPKKTAAVASSPANHTTSHLNGATRRRHQITRFDLRARESHFHHKIKRTHEMLGVFDTTTCKHGVAFGRQTSPTTNTPAKLSCEKHQHDIRPSTTSKRLLFCKSPSFNEKTFVYTHQVANMSQMSPYRTISKSTKIAIGEKGKNFSEDEEIQLCRSYLVVGKDSAIGESITAHFQKARSESAEMWQYRSLESKWRVISRDVSKFCGAYANVRALAVSGANIDDDLDRACDMYKQVERDNEPFKCGFGPNAACQQQGQTKPAPSCAAAATGEGDVVRPTSMNAAKAMAQAAADEALVQKRIANATAALTRASMKRVCGLEDANQLALLAARLVSLDDDAQVFF